MTDIEIPQIVKEMSYGISDSNDWHLYKPEWDFTFPGGRTIPCQMWVFVNREEKEKGYGIDSIEVFGVVIYAINGGDATVGEIADYYQKDRDVTWEMAECKEHAPLHLFQSPYDTITGDRNDFNFIDSRVADGKVYLGHSMTWYWND